MLSEGLALVGFARLLFEMMLRPRTGWLPATNLVLGFEGIARMRGLGTRGRPVVAARMRKSNFEGLNSPMLDRADS